jgi:SAM-dependent methyltransferase
MTRRWLARLKEQHTNLSYGRDIIGRWCGAYIGGLNREPVNVLDIGCGRYGADLLNVRDAARGRQVRLFGVEYSAANVEEVRRRGVSAFALDVEHDRLPFEDGCFDIVIANQIVEHVKEIFWVFAEISRVLRPGGLLVVGVPNLASLHNRLLLLGGEQPSTIEPLGPHVRGFTAPALRRLVEADGYFKVMQVKGANFYPFPPPISTALSRLFPTLSVGLFVAARRQQRPGTFLHVLDTRHYETAYFRGDSH